MFACLHFVRPIGVKDFSCVFVCVAFYQVLSSEIYVIFTLEAIVFV